MDTWAIRATAVLAFAVMMIAQQLGPLWRPQGRARPKKRVNARVSQRDVDDIFWPSKRSSGNSSGGYQSKHRLTGSARQPQRARRGPRHAAPPAR